LFFIGAAAGLCTGTFAVLRRADEKQKGRYYSCIFYKQVTPNGV
jgi:hypothetical protein